MYCIARIDARDFADVPAWCSVDWAFRHPVALLQGFAVGIGLPDGCG